MKHKLNLLHRIQRRVSGLGYLSGGRTSSLLYDFSQMKIYEADGTSWCQSQSRG